MTAGGPQPRVAPRVAAQLQARHLERRLGELELGVVGALSMLLDLKRLTHGPHATRLTAWARRVGERLGLAPAELHAVETAAVLRDIGKLAVPSEILGKPGRLTEAEMAVVRRHSEHGWAVLRGVPGLEAAAHIVLHHHERWDGLGYPSGLAGGRIPVGARLVALVDTFDAMLSDRPYRRGRPLALVIDELRGEAGHQFDPEILRHFLDLAGRHADEIARWRAPAA